MARMARTYVTLLSIALLMHPASAADPKPARADFSGAWALDERSSSDRGTNTNTEPEASKPQVGGRGGGGVTLPGAGTSNDIPFEAMVDADRINVSDEG